MYTTREYAAMAAKANEQGKRLEIINGELVLTDPPPPTPEETQKRYIYLVQSKILDAKAAERGYDSVDAAAKYIGNTINPQWAAEGQALRDWAVLVWGKCYEILAEVLAGQRPIPAEEELFAELPSFSWPEI